MTAQTIPNCGDYLVELDKGTLANQFVLDSPTAGKLDNTAYVLDGSVDFQDVSIYAQNVFISRGRKNPFADTSGQPSTATITLDNNNFYFSLVNTASPYWNATTNRLGFELGTNVRLSREGEYLFVGYITGFKQNVSMPNNSTVTISASDGLFAANNNKIIAFTVIRERSDQRIVKVLDSAGLFSGVNQRALDVGLADLGLAPLDIGASVLDYINRVNNSEAGRIFVSRSDVFTMQARVGRKLSNTIAMLSDVQPVVDIPFQSFEIANN